MYETHARSVVKTVLWRIIATCTSFGTTYFFTGSVGKATEIALAAAVIASISYYLHERFWDSVTWGRVKQRSK